MEKKDIIIPGYEGLYQIYENGDVFSMRKQRFMKPTIREYYDYVTYFLVTREGKGRLFYAHRLVLLHWKGPCPKGMETHHINHNKADNHYTNLTYVTHRENILKSYREGGRTSHWALNPKIPHSVETRIKMSNAKMKDCAVVDTKTKQKQEFNSVADLCKRFKISRRTFNRYNEKLYKDRYEFKFM